MNSGLGTEILYFAAQTLRSKIAHDFGQLPLESHESLSHFMLSLLENFSSAPNVIRTQICLAVADLVLQTEDKWSDAIGTFFQLYGNRDEMTSCLLLLLAFLAEESNNPRININPTSRTNFKQKQIKSHSTNILNFLLQNTRGNDETLQHVLKSLKSWLDIKGVSVEQLTENQLFFFLFEALKNETLFDSAVDCLSSVIQFSKYSPNRIPLLQMINENLIKLEPVVRESLETENIDFLLGYCRLIIEFGDAHSKDIVENPNSFKFLIDVIKELSNIEEINEYASEFWVIIADTLIDSEFERYRPFFFPYFQSLISSSIPKLSYQIGRDYSPSQFNELESKRKDTGEILQSYCSIVGGENCLAIWASSLESIISNPTSQWQQVEALLYFIELMAPLIDFSTSTSAPIIFQQLTILTTSTPHLHHPSVIFRISQCFSSYAHWTRRQSSFLEFEINYLIALLRNSEYGSNSKIFQSAIRALHFLAKACPIPMKIYFPSLNELFMSLNFPTLEDKLKTDEILAMLISVFPQTESNIMTETILTPIAQSIFQLSQQQPGNTISLDFTYLTIKRFGALVNNIKPPWRPTKGASTSTIQVSSSIVLQVWPAFQKLAQNLQEEPKILEALADTLSNCFQTCKTHLHQIVPTVLQFSQECFRLYPLPSFLRTAECILEVFTTSVPKDDISVLVKQISISIQERIKVNGSEADQLLNQPETFSQYFSLLSTCLKYSPNSIFLRISLQEGCFGETLFISLMALSIQTPDIINSALDYLNALLNFALYGRQFLVNPTQTKEQTVRDYGLMAELQNRLGEILTTLLNGICSLFPIVISWRSVSMLLDNFNIYFQSGIFSNSLKLVLDTIQSVQLTETEKINFIKIFTEKKQGNFDSVVLKVENFALLCRRRAGMELSDI